jgi:hypothetical protein
MAKKRRKMTAKQIKHFGTKRQKAALKAKRSGAHRARTKTNPPRKRTVVAKRAAPRKRAKKSAAKHRRNPTPMIISWAAGNPAGRSTKVAKSKRKKVYATAKRSNAGRRPAKKRIVRHLKWSNPGALGRPMDWLQGGAGVIAGVVGTRAIPQMLMGPSNTGPLGYGANAATAVALGWLTHMLFPRNQVLVTAVIAGGFAGLLSRIIADKTPFGQQLSLTGLGDHGFGMYQKSNFPYPQRIAAPRGPNSSMFTYGDGSQTIPMLTNAGSDSSLAC